jgi:hypothetical protein
MSNPNTNARDCDCGFDDDRACPRCSSEADEAFMEEIRDELDAAFAEAEDDGSEDAHREWIRANDRDD